MPVGRKICFILICLLCACSTAEDPKLAIEFSADRSKIVISNIEQTGLVYLKRNLKTDTTYQQLVSVLQTPTEQDSTAMEVEWPGHLTLSNDQLIFTPDTPFRKGKAYLVETMLNVKFAKIREILKSDVGHKVKAEQKILQR